MATGTAPDERFEDVDWDEIEDSTFDFSGLQAVRTVIFGGLGLLFVYDLFFVGRRDPTVAAIGWDASQLDWLFVATILAMLLYAVVPLARNPRMTRYYWRRFRGNKAAVLSLAYLLVVFAVGTVGPLVFEQPQLDIIRGYQPPVFTTVDASVPVQCVGETTTTQVVTDDGDTRPVERCHGSFAHPLGTTGQGKDILMLMMFGMRVSMQIGLITTLILIVVGTAVGTLAAYRGGAIDELLMRYVDVQIAFPEFPLYLLLVYLFGGSLFMMILIFGLLGWGGIARLVRGEALQRTEEEYIKAARASGASTYYVVRKHVVPNVSNTVVTAATLAIPGLILAEASLSFLQLGDPSIPSWGQVINDGRSDLSSAWWISTVPGVFLFTTIMAFNFIGDALNDALDPRRNNE
jgi:peptide/nickel transport system permease protein